jgi:hypothetical protein
MAKSNGGSFKIGRSAVSGKFIPVKVARQHPRTTEVETIKRPTTPKGK